MVFKHPFYFLRHGQTDWNKSKTVQGQANSQLDETGRAQAIRASEILAMEHIERIVSSPLDRTRDTAAAVAAKHDVPITYDDGLMECHLGDLQGKPRGDEMKGYWRGEFNPPNGETFGDFSDRVWNAMERAVSLGPNTLIVAHGGLWIAAHRFTKVEPWIMPMPNALPILVEPNEGVWQARILDHTDSASNG